jgi:hypothetical protein
VEWCEQWRTVIKPRPQLTVDEKCGDHAGVRTDSPYVGRHSGLCGLTLSQLMLHICGVSKTFGEWYQKTNKTEDTNKLTLLAFKIIAILHNSCSVIDS